MVGGNVTDRATLDAGSSAAAQAAAATASATAAGAAIGGAGPPATSQVKETCDSGLTSAMFVQLLVSFCHVSHGALGG